MTALFDREQIAAVLMIELHDTGKILVRTAVITMGEQDRTNGFSFGRYKGSEKSDPIPCLDRDILLRQGFIISVAFHVGFVKIRACIALIRRLIILTDITVALQKSVKNLIGDKCSDGASANRCSPQNSSYHTLPHYVLRSASVIH